MPGWIDELPGGVDPCGENGEFHTIVTDTPEFKFPLSLERVGKRRVGDLELTLFGLSGRGVDWAFDHGEQG